MKEMTSKVNIILMRVKIWLRVTNSLLFESLIVILSSLFIFFLDGFFL